MTVRLPKVLKAKSEATNVWLAPATVLVPLACTTLRVISPTAKICVVCAVNVMVIVWFGAILPSILLGQVRIKLPPLIVGFARRRLLWS